MSVLDAIKRENEQAALQSRSIERIRITPAAIAGTVTVDPFDDGRSCELLIHPRDWAEILILGVQEKWLKKGAIPTAVFGIPVAAQGATA